MDTLLEIFSCEISEKARHGKKNAFLFHNSYENFPAKNMKKYFFPIKKYLFIFVAGKFSCEISEK
jgi:hypothetical protein